MTWTIRSASMSGRALINSLPISSVDTDFFATDASELYRHVRADIRTMNSRDGFSFSNETPSPQAIWILNEGLSL